MHHPGSSSDNPAHSSKGPQVPGASELHRFRQKRPRHERPSGHDRAWGLHENLHPIHTSFRDSWAAISHC